MCSAIIDWRYPIYPLPISSRNIAFAMDKLAIVDVDRDRSISFGGLDAR